jgi:hypothetical protein
VCRASVGACDIAETCTGSGANCPADTFYPSTFLCHVSGGSCDNNEFCPGNGPACPPSFAPATQVCRASAGACDIAESCSGSSANCPADGKEPKGYVCGGPPFDCGETPCVCEKPGMCDGMSNACPANGLYQTGDMHLCSAANPTNNCSANSYCNGSGPGCPVTYQPKGTKCNKSVAGGEECGACNASGVCGAPFVAGMCM